MEDIHGGGCKEFRVFGPPGTGKTTWLVKQVRRAAEKYGGEKVLCCSFTKTAATEMVNRITPPDEEPLIPDSSVGTLHAICYRALGSPTLAETKISQWNAEHPDLGLSKKSAARVMEDGLDESDTPEEGSADALLAMYSAFRNRLIPYEEMPAQVQHFAKLWEGWKQDCDFMDFTDLLVSGSKELYYPPNGASVAFVDEAQDMTPLQLKVVRNWEKSLRFYILVGDDDQCIFRFSGASPDALIAGDIPQENKIILKQSWRVPVSVHRLAEKWIKKVSVREPKEYLPTDREGAVRRLPGATVKDARPAVVDAAKQIAAGRAVMFLTACSYHLRTSLIPLLKEHGIPFWNPYRVTQEGMGSVTQAASATCWPPIWSPTADAAACGSGARSSLPAGRLRAHSRDCSGVGPGRGSRNWRNIRTSMGMNCSTSTRTGSNRRGWTRPCPFRRNGWSTSSSRTKRRAWLFPFPYSGAEDGMPLKQSRAASSAQSTASKAGRPTWCTCSPTSPRSPMKESSAGRRGATPLSGSSMSA